MVSEENNAERPALFSNRPEHPLSPPVLDSRRTDELSGSDLPNMMAEYRLSGHAFDDTEIELLDRAFRLAWDRFLKTGMMDARNMGEAQEFIAQRILVGAADGERDAWRLARDAFFRLWQVKFSDKPTSKKRLRRQGRAPQNAGSRAYEKHDNAEATAALGWARRHF